jgi:hypothetical protein
MGIRTIIAIGFTLVAVNAQAATNRWTYTGANVNNYFWDIEHELVAQVARQLSATSRTS